MSLERTKSQLSNVLSDPDNKVVALTGRWGTGKTYLLKDVLAKSDDDRFRNALHISLFGVSDVRQLKLKLLQAILQRNSTFGRSIPGYTKAIQTALEGFNKGFAALENILLTVIPALLKERAIVLDDIERRDSRLHVGEILGFIDEFIQPDRASRFILVLNSDELQEKEAWVTMREKVVDEELRLSTSPAEAFAIARTLRKPVYADPLLEAVKTCGVTNIRVISKVVRVVNNILRTPNLPASVLARVVPSTVLLSAIHYRGLVDGPTSEFVLARGGDPWGRLFEANENEKSPDADPREKRWNELLQELGIGSCDEYERLVVEYLESGLFSADDIRRIIERYVAEQDRLATGQEMRDLRSRMVWEYKTPIEEFIAQARSFVDRIHHLDPYSVSGFADEISRLGGEGPAIGEALVNGWIARYEAGGGSAPGEDAFDRQLHAQIKEAFDRSEAREHANVSVAEAIATVAQGSSWGTREEMSINGTSDVGYERLICELDPASLRDLLRGMTKISSSKGPYLASFKAGIDAFRVACQRIANDPEQSRLGGLLNLIFERYGLGSLVQAPQAAPSATAAP